MGSNAGQEIADLPLAKLDGQPRRDDGVMDGPRVRSARTVGIVCRLERVSEALEAAASASARVAWTECSLDRAAARLESQPPSLLLVEWCACYTVAPAEFA